MEKLPEGTWVIVSVGPKKYVGKLTTLEEDEAKFDDASIQEWYKGINNTEHLLLSPCFEYLNQLRMRQTPNGPVPEGPQAFLLPLDLSVMGRSELFTKFDSVVIINRLEEEDQQVYIDHLNQIKDTIMKTRAMRAGIEIPKVTL